MYRGNPHAVHAAIADARRLIWQYIFHIFCLLGSIHFSYMFLSLKSMEFGEEYYGTEAGPMKLILRWNVQKLVPHVCRKPWMKAGHYGSVHVNAVTSVERRRAGLQQLGLPARGLKQHHRILTSLWKWVNAAKPHPLAFATSLVVVAGSWKAWERKQSHSGST